MSKQQPSKPASKVAQGKKDDHDLTTILDESQRADLTLLIANASESMRRLLLENFDAGKLSISHCMLAGSNLCQRSCEAFFDYR